MEGGYTPQRHALIIGVNYAGTDWGELTGQLDATRFQRFLLDDRRWQSEEITLMLDMPEGKHPSYLRPTRDNIIREIMSMTNGARPGDHFVFFYAGHSDQLPCKGSSEDDGMDEVIVPCDCNTKLNNPIVDNELKHLLVDPLPVGSSLTAIFDSCHSGTLLDLPHYHCNAVYVPWVSKGQRQADTLRNSITRGLARSSALASQKSKFPSLPRSAIQSPARMALSPLNARAPRIPWQHVDSPIPSTFGSPYGSPAYGSPSYTSPMESLPASPITSPPSVSPQHTLFPQNGRSPMQSIVPQVHDPQPQHTLVPPRIPSSQSQATLVPSRPQPHSQHTILPPQIASMATPSSSPPNTQGRSRPVKPTLKTSLAALANDPNRFASFFGGGRCASPEPIPGSDCDGWCQARDNERAHVVSLSACADQERAWEDWTGETMTSSLINILKKSPNCSYHDLITHLSHRLHKTSRNLHRWTRDYKKSRESSLASTPVAPGNENVHPDAEHEDPGEVIEETYEMDNFQNPQLSSHERLDLHETFLL